MANIYKLFTEQSGEFNQNRYGNEIHLTDTFVSKNSDNRGTK